MISCILPLTLLYMFSSVFDVICVIELMADLICVCPGKNGML